MACPACTKTWKLIDENNPMGLVLQDDVVTTLDYTLNTIGAKTIGVEYASTTANTYGAMCTSTVVTVVQSGGSAGEF